MKLELTDSVVRNLIPNPVKKYTVWDTSGDPSGFAVRVRTSGAKTYVVIARPDKARRQVMVTLGRAGTLKLSAARTKALEALRQMKSGVNPNQEKRKLAIETFGALAELYIDEELPNKRQGKEVERYLRSDWLGQIPHRTRVKEGGRNVWKTEWKDGKDAVFRDRPSVLITREDILARLNTIRRTRGSYAARHALNAVRRVFAFAFNHGHSGIKISPAASLRDKNVGLNGKMMRRQRV